LVVDSDQIAVMEIGRRVAFVVVDAAIVYTASRDDRLVFSMRLLMRLPW